MECTGEKKKELGILKTLWMSISKFIINLMLETTDIYSVTVSIGLESRH